MSIQHVAAVLDCRHPELTPPLKMLLVALANRANANDLCWPHQEVIAGEASMSRRSVNRHLNELEELGYVSRQTKRRGQGRGSLTIFTLNMGQFRSANLAPLSLEVPNEVVRSATGGSSSEPTEPTYDIDRARDAREGFSKFWKLYPRSVGRSEAEKAFKKLSPLEQVEATNRLHLFLPQWADKEHKFIPHASTWLNKRRWEDDPEPAAPQKHQRQAKKPKPLQVMDDLIASRLAEAKERENAGK